MNLNIPSWRGGVFCAPGFRCQSCGVCGCHVRRQEIPPMRTKFRPLSTPLRGHKFPLENFVLFRIIKEKCLHLERGCGIVLGYVDIYTALLRHQKHATMFRHNAPRNGVET